MTPSTTATAGALEPTRTVEPVPRLRRLWRVARRRPASAIGAAVVALFIAMALGAPWIARVDPLQTDWKLVRKHGRPWELFDLSVDRTEQHDRAVAHPALVADLEARYEAWAERCGVIPRQAVLDLYERRGKGLPPE